MNNTHPRGIITLIKSKVKNNGLHFLEFLIILPFFFF
jgi:hypothetical protein